jgi:predicted PurR-regulated permease PerM
MQRPPGREIARITLGVLFIGLLIAISLLVLQPFLGALVWATMIVVATWPMMLAVEARLGGRRWAAVLVMTAIILLLLVVPLTVAVLSIVENADTIVAWTQGLANATVPAPPQWVADLPLVGSNLAAEWAALAATSRDDLMTQVAPYMRSVIQWFAGRAGGVGLTLLHFLLTVVMTAILYANGEAAALSARRFGRRLADDRGESSVVLAGQAIRAVALGIVVTAIAQSIAAGVGLALSGVPYATVLTAVTFVLCIAQLPPLLVLLPAVGWLYWSDHTLWGTVLLVWSLPVAVMDNVMRPVLIKRGADLPLLLIFAGVIGGLISFGIIGLFVGPVVLAVTYRLLESWIADVDHERPDTT